MDKIKLKSILLIIFYFLIILFSTFLTLKLIGNIDLSNCDIKLTETYQTNFYLKALPILLISYLLYYFILKDIFSNFSLENNAIKLTLILNILFLLSIGLITLLSIIQLIIFLFFSVFAIFALIITIIIGILIYQKISDKNLLLIIILMTIPSIIISLTFALYYTPLTLFGC